MKTGGKGNNYIMTIVLCLMVIGLILICVVGVCYLIQSQKRLQKILQDNSNLIELIKDVQVNAKQEYLERLSAADKTMEKRREENKKNDTDLQECVSKHKRMISDPILSSNERRERLVHSDGDYVPVGLSNEDKKLLDEFYKF